LSSGERLPTPTWKPARSEWRTQFWSSFLALFIFAAILYFVDPEGAGEQIFNKAFPVIFALVGTIVGYIFGTARKQ